MQIFTHNVGQDDLLDSVSGAENILHTSLRYENLNMFMLIMKDTCSHSLLSLAWMTLWTPTNALLRVSKLNSIFTIRFYRLKFNLTLMSRASSSWSWHHLDTSSWGTTLIWMWTLYHQDWTGNRSRTDHICSPQHHSPSDEDLSRSQNMNHLSLQPDKRWYC